MTKRVMYTIIGRCDKCNAHSVMVKDMIQDERMNFTGVWICPQGCLK